MTFPFMQIVYPDQIHLLFHPHLPFPPPCLKTLSSCFIVLFSSMCTKYLEHINLPLHPLLSHSSLLLIYTPKPSVFTLLSFIFKDQIPHMRENMKYHSRSVWLISLNMIPIPSTFLISFSDCSYWNIHKLLIC